jgi:hypothetical protein
MRAAQPARAALACLNHRDQPLIDRGQDLAAVVAHRDGILDADPELARQVYAGLHGDHVAGGQCVLGALGEAWCFVDVEADTVPEPVTEMLGVPRLLDHRVGRRIGTAARLARPHGLQPRHTCADSTSSYSSRARVPGAPAATVRVQSEQ